MVAEMAKMRFKDLKMPSPDGSDLREFLTRVEDFMPHYPVVGTRNTRQILEMVLSRGGQKIDIADPYFGGLLEQMVAVASPSVMRREGAMLPRLEHLEKIKEYLKLGAYEKVAQKLQESHLRAFESGGKYRPILEYSMRGDQTLSSYVKGIAATEAWTLRGNGAKLLNAYTKFMAPGGDKVRAEMLRSTIIPTALGRWTPEQAARQLRWSNKVVEVADWLETPTAKLIPEGARKTLRKWLMGSIETSAVNPLSRGIQGYLYLSTLGGNPAAAARNLFQIALTTGPLLGWRATARGIESSLKKAGSYFEARSQGFDHNKAFKMAFPHYFESGLPLSPIAEEAIGGMLSGNWERAVGSAMPGLQGAGRTTDKVKSALMSMFGFSESAVRLTSFEAAMQKGLKEGLTIQQAIPLARQVVQETQFVPGLSGMPHFLAKMGPLSRQLLQFPARYFGFMTGTALRAGSGTKALGAKWGPLAGANPGTLARMYVWSDLIANVASQVVGTNLEQSLLMGAMPGFRGEGAFAPLPVVPPFFAIMGAPLKDLASGDFRFEETRRILPLTMPGGVGFSKLVGYLPIPGGPEVAKLLERKYVDYRAVTPDGRYPVYTAKGGLTGYMTIGQIVMQGLGIPEGGPAQQTEQALMKMLTSNRERIRDMKRGYIRAVMNSNVKEAEAIDRQFGELFPELKSIRKLISQEDFDRSHQRLEVTRLEQMLDTMPPAVRPMYAEALRTALLGVDPEILGLGEAGISGQMRTAKQRGPSRKYRRPQRTREYRDQLTPFRSGGMNLNEVSRPTHLGFQSFEGFGG
ncbi:hypothetical protein HWQ67_16140 [Candidatus Magnetobacterium casensis]|uniref:Large polyvalent protein associated domain-containing protein n=2 Tax=Candidatus Magnetobacterium casense TaxID=1455061 RepID=A0ABS6S2N2_9BACT|nr:hypothetical protein [Candidatus Magnetobacterium casensis]